MFVSKTMKRDLVIYTKSIDTARSGMIKQIFDDYECRDRFGRKCG